MSRTVIHSHTASPRGIALLLGLLLPTTTVAAPLDEFLTAMPGYEPRHGEVEVGLGVMNGTVDVLGVRDEHLDARGDSIGDYKDYHLRGGLALTRRIWADAGLWKRSVKTPFDEGENYTWQVGAQYQATVNVGWLPAIALRLSAWGDSADQVLKGSPTPFMGSSSLTASNIRVKSPSDQQIQGDLIATWKVAEATTLSMFLGMGKSEVEVEEFFVKFTEPLPFTSSSDCEYKISYDPATSGVLLTRVNNIAGCNATDYRLATSRQIPEGLYVNYDATYFQLGGMVKWFNDDWRLKVGYRFQKWDRDEVDDAIRLYQHADTTVYDTNHHLSGEVGYKVFNQWALFFRSQYMTNQFVGEVPFSYNLYSSHKFAKEYGFLTFGLTSGF